MTAIMVQGTTSSAGKSLMCSALCKIFNEDGLKVYPFKSQNMSSKSHVTEEGYEISVAQALQATAAGLKPNPNMNPILLKPTTDRKSQVFIKGSKYKDMDAVEYFQFKTSLRPMIVETFKEIEKSFDVVVIEGAGSPAEINLKENDIVNMGMAEIADAPVLLIADIDRGGVFASLYGTVMLLEEDERKRVKGLIINKFRGDKTLLEPGLKMIEELLNIPVVGTIPYLSLNLEEEDSLVDRKNNEDLSNVNVEDELERLAKAVRENMDMDYVYSLIQRSTYE
ncbi:cobyric acid synthase [Tissierella sp. MSJ-40]|uniref:Cobyric acid synthase n=1 Tax=Tissierella simiarum TaxID=2841534 RepID=A0ABS6E3F7_9FIRM|nr:cobyric acid synthase [Tissierella simiarum]MBU5437437.1 cobyric acid synthase [Tissierella simiarum]